MKHLLSDLKEAALTWAVCCCFECTFLTAASAHVKHTFIALGWGIKKLGSVKIKLLAFTTVSNTNTALPIQTLEKYRELVY